MRGRVREHRNDFHELIDRTGPAVDQKEWLGIGATPLLVDEVQVEVCYLGAKMTQAVQMLFVLAPVVLCAPVVDELAQIGEVGAVFPASIGNFVRETCSVKPGFEVGEDLVGYLDGKGFDFGHVGALSVCKYARSVARHCGHFPRLAGTG